MKNPRSKIETGLKFSRSEGNYGYMEQGNKQTTLVAYAINTDPHRRITDEERLYHEGKYVIEENEQSFWDVTITPKLWAEMQKEKMCYVQDLDHKGRWLKFYSPTHLEEWGKMSQEEQENYIPTPRDLGFGKGYSFKIKNGEIRKYKQTYNSLSCVDPYYGAWGNLSACNILIDLGEEQLS